MNTTKVFFGAKKLLFLVYNYLILGKWLYSLACGGIIKIEKTISFQENYIVSSSIRNTWLLNVLGTQSQCNCESNEPEFSTLRVTLSRAQRNYFMKINSQLPGKYLRIFVIHSLAL